MPSSSIRWPDGILRNQFVVVSNGLQEWFGSGAAARVLAATLPRDSSLRLGMTVCQALPSPQVSYRTFIFGAISRSKRRAPRRRGGGRRPWGRGRPPGVRHNARWVRHRLGGPRYSHTILFVD